jgi:hypothetical protein
MEPLDLLLFGVDADIVEQQVTEVLNDDADLAERLLERIENVAERRNTPAIRRALEAARSECRLRIDDQGRARATWLTVQVLPAYDDVVLHVGVA